MASRFDITYLYIIKINSSNAISFISRINWLRRLSCCELLGQFRNDGFLYFFSDQIYSYDLQNHVAVSVRWVCPFFFFPVCFLVSLYVCLLTPIISGLHWTTLQLEMTKSIVLRYNAVRIHNLHFVKLTRTSLVSRNVNICYERSLTRILFTAGIATSSFLSNSCC